jgi:hypothetical protein
LRSGYHIPWARLREERRRTTFHDLKATAVTWMALRGDNPLAIMQRAAHRDVKTTQRYLRAAEMVEPPGIEFDSGNNPKSATSLVSRARSMRSKAVSPASRCTGVLVSPLESTWFLETFWRQRMGSLTEC